MASSQPFSFLRSKLLAPIICIECGNNAYCIRRMPMSSVEVQTFSCMGCGSEIVKERGEAASDAEIEKQAEALVGLFREKFPT
jgi:hypothetical protein